MHSSRTTGGKTTCELMNTAYGNHKVPPSPQDWPALAGGVVYLDSMLHLHCPGATGLKELPQREALWPAQKLVGLLNPSQLHSIPDFSEAP